MAETCLNSLCEKLEEDAKPGEEFMEGARDPCGGMIPWDERIGTSHQEQWTLWVSGLAEIQSKSGVEQWHHIPTKDNPADDASRGVTAASLGLPCWQHGPEFLIKPPEAWR